MIGLTGVGLFMDADSRKASTSRIADTVEYVVQLVGAEYAGIGLDYVRDAHRLSEYLQANRSLFGGGEQYPVAETIDFAPPSILPDVTEELLRRGLSEREVHGILGQNYLRVMEADCEPQP